MKFQMTITAIACAVCLGMASPIFAAAKPLYKTDPILGKGLKYLLAKQGPDGSWVPQIGPGVTAMAVRALLEAGYPASSPAIVKAMKFIETFRRPDGGFFHQAEANYNTCLVLRTLALMPGDKYKSQIKATQRFLISLQRVAPMRDDKGHVITRDNPWYGGVNYGAGHRPDLSNTSFFISALRHSGVPASSPAIQRALVFVTHCQENSETNPEPFAKGLNNGGFIYTTANGGQSAFGDTDHLGSHSTLTAYGTMTYAGLKSMIYAGLTKNDPRVKAAVKWIRANWTLNSNPGTGGSRMGLFYYYVMFTAALNALHVQTITDDNGIAHNWRTEIHSKLKSIQSSNGSWKNKWSPRWLEFSPVLVTTYACIILDTMDQKAAAQ